MPNASNRRMGEVANNPVYNAQSLPCNTLGNVYIPPDYNETFDPSGNDVLEGLISERDTANEEGKVVLLRGGGHILLPDHVNISRSFTGDYNYDFINNDF